MIFRMGSLRRYSFRITAVALSALALASLAPGRGGAEQQKDRVAVAKCVTGTGSLVRREGPDKPWQIVKEGEILHSGDWLLGLPGAGIVSTNSAVRLNFLSDLGGVTPFPIIETVIVLHDSKGEDLDFRLDRGRIEFANNKDKGEVHVRPRIREEARGDITLEPQASCSLEIYGRWPAGVHFTKEPKAGVAPTLHVLFLVTRGEIFLRLDKVQVAMKAPPGPALIEWDSVTGGDPSPQRLDALPSWTKTDDKSEVVKQRKAALEQFRKTALDKSIGTALDEFINSDDPAKRRMAVNAMGAMDELKRLGTALATTKHGDVWDNGVLVLRHWIGRGPGQDQKLYAALIKEAEYKPVDAEAVLQLLHSFGEAELARPETYEMLIDYLAHDRLAVRGLANWHLVRLVPAGKKIGYDPLTAKEARDKAIAQWRKLVPEGKLPPKTAPEK